MDFGFSYNISILLTNILSLLGGILLWSTFIIFGFVARRYEILFKKKTEWKVLVVAPSGILVYVLIQIYAYVDHGPLTSTEQMVAYPLVILSGLLCIYGAYRFKKVTEKVMG